MNRAVVVLLAAILGFTLTLGAPLEGQAPWTLPEIVPDPAEERARAELEAAIHDYYRGWETRRLPDRPRGICDVDRGHRCLAADLDGGCFLRRPKCRTWEESALLVERLTRLALENPSDPVVTAHAVYAAVKLSFFDQAVRVLGACDPDGRWVCDLMAGYAYHRMGSSARAAPAFRSALDTMDPETRCLFTDIEWFLSGAVEDRYRAIPCGARAEAHDWFWWASDPLLAADATNDRWTEHLARIVERMMTEDFETRRSWTDRRWPQDRRFFELRVLRGAVDSFEPRVVRRRHVPTFLGWTSRRAAFNHFVPEVFALDSLHPDLEYRLEARLERGPGSDEGYTRAGGRVHEIPVQHARFLEGDSMVVALASRLTESEIGGTGQAFFMASTGPGDVMTLDPSPLRETVVFAGKVANRRQVVGIEVLTPGDDARSREVIEPLPEGTPLLSDLLLYRPLGSDEPATRVRAAGMMHGTTRIPKERELGLYWEGYGLGGRIEVEVSLRLEPVGGGFFGGLAEALGLGGADATGTVTWTVRTPEEGRFSDAVTLDLSGLDEGAYDLVLTMTMPDGTTVESRRRFEVVEEQAR